MSTTTFLITENDLREILDLYPSLNENVSITDYSGATAVGPVPAPPASIQALPSPLHLQKFFPKPEADRLFTTLSSLPFAPFTWSKQIGVLPRLICQYDRTTNSNAGVEELINIIETSFNQRVVGVWCNLYRNGNEYCGHHRDSYDDNGRPINVFTFSFGATRRFLLKPDGKWAKSIPFDLASGDLFYFDSKTNANHTHSIPKTKKAVGPRISIVAFTI